MEHLPWKNPALSRSVRCVDVFYIEKYLNIYHKINKMYNDPSWQDWFEGLEIVREQSL